EAYKAVGTGLQVRIRSCDLLNPRRQTPFSDATTWEQRLLGLLGNRLAGLKLAGSTVQAAAPFDRLHAEAPHAINDGPLVSVIAECRQAGRKLPRQAGISKVELPATRWRYSAGVRSPSESWGRSSLYSSIHQYAASRTSSRRVNRCWSRTSSRKVRLKRSM